MAAQANLVNQTLTRREAVKLIWKDLKEELIDGAIIVSVLCGPWVLAFLVILLGN